MTQTKDSRAYHVTLTGGNVESDEAIEGRPVKSLVFAGNATGRTHVQKTIVWALHNGADIVLTRK